MSDSEILAAHIEHLRALAAARRRRDIALTALDSALRGSLAAQVSEEMRRAERVYDDAVQDVLLSGSTLIETVTPGGTK